FVYSRDVTSRTRCNRPRMTSPRRLTTAVNAYHNALQRLHERESALRDAESAEADARVALAHAARALLDDYRTCRWRIPNREQQGPANEPNDLPLRIPRRFAQETRARPGQSVDTSRLRRCGHMRRAYTSRRHRRVIEPTTVRLPAIRTDTRACAALGR